MAAKPPRPLLELEFEMRTNLAKTLLTASALAVGLCQLAVAGTGSAAHSSQVAPAHTGSRDPFTDGARAMPSEAALLAVSVQTGRVVCKQGSFDPYQDGLRSGRVDPYTDGARMGPRDAFSDGGNRVSSRDAFSDGGNRVGPRDGYSDGYHGAGNCPSRHA